MLQILEATSDADLLAISQEDTCALLLAQSGCSMLLQVGYFTSIHLLLAYEVTITVFPFIFAMFNFI